MSIIIIYHAVKGLLRLQFATTGSLWPNHWQKSSSEGVTFVKKRTQPPDNAIFTACYSGYQYKPYKLFFSSDSESERTLLVLDQKTLHYESYIFSINALLPSNVTFFLNRIVASCIALNSRKSGKKTLNE